MPTTQMPGAERRGQLLRREPLQKPMDPLSVPARALNSVHSCHERMNESFTEKEKKRKEKKTGSAPATVDYCVMWRGWERYSGSLSVLTVHSTLPSVLLVGKSGRFGGGGTRAVGTWTVHDCPSARAVMENLHAGGVGARAPRFHTCNGMESECTSVCKIYLWFSIAECGTNVLWKWMFRLRTGQLWTLVAICLYATRGFYCTEIYSVCRTKWILLLLCILLFIVVSYLQ